MEKSKEKKIEWTKEQTEIIDSMIKESETIGYAQGFDDAIEEMINDLKLKSIRKFEK